MPEPVNVALAQTTSTDDFAANAAYAESLVARAAGAGAELVAFPEVDPWGRVTARLPEGNGLVHAPFDLGLLRKIRRELPMGRDVEGEDPWI